MGVCGVRRDHTAHERGRRDRRCASALHGELSRDANCHLTHPQLDHSHSDGGETITPHIFALLEPPLHAIDWPWHGGNRRHLVELARVSLEDKYTLQSGRIYLSGIQALVRLPLMQRARDRAAGLNTAGFISGYRGSPLGTYDSALWQAKALLENNDIRFQPGLNEDLAATAVWGSQQVGLFPGATVDGVFGIWYGKGPGVDRSLDVLRHANWAGTAPNGGVLAIAGDDHGAQSTTTAYQCEQAFEAAMMPILNPATIQDYLDLGLFGFALSRFSGCWVAFKAASEAVDSSASVYVDPQRVTVTMPSDFEMPPGGLHIRWPHGGMDWAVEQERRLHGPKLAAAQAFARANSLDRVVIDSPQPRLGIVTTGKAYLDVRQALSELGITEQRAAELGIRIYKVALTWPLEPQGALGFAQNLKDILVVEEKRGFVENQLVRLLYNVEASRRPSIVGKTDETGAILLPSTGELTPTVVARAIVARLKRFGDASQFDERLARLEAFERPAPPVSSIQRTPFFCSGCPHNTSTRVPEGSRAMAGIGCHSMALFMPDRHTATLTHMGGEGVNWIGQAPFTTERHVFQNLGDGTYAHSGLMAIRAAAAAGVNITYKILFNDAVAMTGGQPVEGAMTVPQIAQQVLAEGARRVVVVADEPDKYPKHAGFPAGVVIRHRDDLDAVQRELRDIAGPHRSHLRSDLRRGETPPPQARQISRSAGARLHQRCRMRRLRRLLGQIELYRGAADRDRTRPQAPHRPVELQQGFFLPQGLLPELCHCPRRHAAQARRACDNDGVFANLPEPKAPPLQRPYGILVTGVGGTGVVTLGALLGMAAHLEGKGCTVLDISGLAQKNGAVMSHVRLAPQPEDLYAVRVASGGADVLLACDPVVAASPAALSRLQSGTKAVINSHAQPTAAFIFKPDIDFETAKMLQAIKTAAARRHHRRHRPCRGADGRFHRRQPVHARLRVPKGLLPLTSRPSRAPSNSTASQSTPTNAVWLGPPRGPRSLPGRGAGAQRVARRYGAGTASSMPWSKPRRVSERLSERRLRTALSQRGANDSHRRSKTCPRLFRLGRGRGAQPVHADGLQGRIRSGAALYRRHVY